MLTWIIQISIISIIFIFLVHHLIGFFKSTLTVPKIKDLVNSPSQKYQNIFDTINSNSNTSCNTNSNTNSYTAIDLLPTSSVTGLDTSTKDMMKDELKSFLKKQLNITSLSNNNNDFLANDFSSNNSLQSAF
jgi:hypothetical protein